VTARKPIVKVGPVAAPVVRTAGQGGLTWVVMELIEAYHVYNFDDRQWAITLFAGTTFVAWLQNTIEQRRGRKLVGA
jgi:hypothetical protein